MKHLPRHPLNIYLNLKYRNKLILTCILAGVIPLITLGVFCYYQTRNLLLDKEQDALSSAIDTAYNSLDYQVRLYENLVTYLALSEIVVNVSSEENQGIIEKFEMLNYEYDVLLDNISVQYPEIAQITLYVDRTDLYHGKQLRPISDLESESWYASLDDTAAPVWHMDQDGYLCVFRKVPNPYIKYVTSFSRHSLCIRLRPEKLFSVLTDISNDYHLQIADTDETFYDYTDDSIINMSYPDDGWTAKISSPLSNGWVITLEKPSVLLAAPANKMAVTVFIILIICFILIYTVSGLLSNFFAQKVNLLLLAMHKVQEGDLTVHIHDDCPDEIGELTNSFQYMIQKLNRLVVEDYKNKITLKETQLMALQAQINPHFLYNCLSAINSKALVNSQKEISQMAQLLSTFYRTTLNKGKAETMLSNEIKNVKSYIEIQLILNDNLFDVVYQIDEPLPEREIPNLLLQPLVENAIMHGILPNSTRRGVLFLTVTQVNDLIHFTIMDNGLGIPPEKLPLLTQTQSDGYGLKNVHERLLLTYGKEYGLKINSILNESTMITFSIPTQERQMKEQNKK
ncbi:MAG: histidine kinase [Lachnospiraceae bacterium]|nr:histidine kinase [Lachnospiraceae bacterium]